MQNYVYLVYVTDETGCRSTAGIFLDEQNAIKFIKENYPQPRNKFTPIDCSDTSNDKIYIDGDMKGRFQLLEKDGSKLFMNAQTSTLSKIGYTGPIAVDIQVQQIMDA